MGFHAGLNGVEKGYFYLVRWLFMKGESNGVCDSGMTAISCGCSEGGLVLKRSTEF